MQNKTFYLFSAETDGEMDSWVATLQKVMENNEAVHDRLREKGTPAAMAAICNSSTPPHSYHLGDRSIVVVCRVLVRNRFDSNYI